MGFFLIKKWYNEYFEFIIAIFFNLQWNFVFSFVYSFYFAGAVKHCWQSRLISICYFSCWFLIEIGAGGSICQKNSVSLEFLSKRFQNVWGHIKNTTFSKISSTKEPVSTSGKPFGLSSQRCIAKTLWRFFGEVSITIYFYSVQSIKTFFKNN